MFKQTALPLILFLSCVAIADEKVPFPVGVILPLSGQSAFGDGIRKGCEMGLEKVNQRAQGLRPIELYFEDDQYNPAKTLTAIKKLVGEKRIEAVITVSSGPSRAVIPVIKQHQLPLIAIATNDGFTSLTNFAFSLWMPPEIEAGAMVDEVLKRGYKRIARFTAENPVFAELNKHFDKGIAGKVEIVLDEKFSPEETDFRTILTKLKVIPDVDAIAVNLMPVAAGNMALQARELGIESALFSAEIFETPEALKAAKGALNHQWYATTATSEEGFFSEFKNRYPDAMTIGAANCYEAIRLVAEGLKSESTKEGIRNYIASVKDFESSLGTLTARDDRTFKIPAAIRLVKDNGYSQLRIVQ